MLWSSGPGQVLGSQVANWVFDIRLVQWLGWVFETQESKKERNNNRQNINTKKAGKRAHSADIQSTIRRNMRSCMFQTLASLCKGDTDKDVESSLTLLIMPCRVVITYVEILSPLVPTPSPAYMCLLQSAGGVFPSLLRHLVRFPPSATVSLQTRRGFLPTS